MDWTVFTGGLFLLAAVMFGLGAHEQALHYGRPLLGLFYLLLAVVSAFGAAAGLS